MNEQLQSALAEILNKTINGIDSSVAFMQAELPDVIEQLLLWYAISNLIYALFGALIIFLSYLAIKKPKKGRSNWMWNWYDHCDSHDMTDIAPFSTLIIIPAGVGLMFISNVMESLQIWIAPKIWLIEYAASLVK